MYKKTKKTLSYNALKGPKIMILLFLAIFCGVFGLAKKSLAATYTVCSSGCTATTFASFFNSRSLGPDDVLEARADTIGGSKTFSEVLTPSSATQGSLGHPAIIRARPGDKISIRGDSGEYGASIYMRNDDSAKNNYITFDGFNLEGYGYAGVWIQGVRGATSPSNGKLSGITIQNMSLTSQQTTRPDPSGDSTMGIIIGYADNLLVRNNSVHIVKQFMPWQTDCFFAAGTSNDVWEGNLCLDENLSGDGHNDGFQMEGGGEAGTFGAQYNHTIRNNTLVHASDSSGNDICTASGAPFNCCSGLKTGACKGAKQLIFFEGDHGGDNYIYNNLAYTLYENSSNLVSVVNVAGSMGNFYLYNNTFYSKNSTAVIFAPGVTNITFKNNIVYGSLLLVSIGDTAVNPANIRNNLYYSLNGSGSGFAWGGAWHGFSEWKALGSDNGTGASASYFSDPLFTSVSSYPYNLRVQSGSAAIDHGASLSNLFATDISGLSRPQGPAWDIGAYEFQSGTPVDTAPAAPTGLSVY